MSAKTKFRKDVHEKGPKDLVKLRQDLRKELFSLRMKNALRALKETHKIRELRKKIAMVNTILTQKIKEKDGNSRQ